MIVQVNFHKNRLERIFFVDSLFSGRYNCYSVSQREEPNFYVDTLEKAAD
jgi:hypothetical protein